MRYPTYCTNGTIPHYQYNHNINLLDSSSLLSLSLLRLEVTSTSRSFQKPVDKTTCDQTKRLYSEWTDTCAYNYMHLWFVIILYYFFKLIMQTLSYLHECPPARVPILPVLVDVPLKPLELGLNVITCEVSEFKYFVVCLHFMHCYSVYE